MKIFITHILTVALLLCSFSMVAQNGEIQIIDIVELKDGISLRGEITGMSGDKTVTLRLISGETVELDRDEVKRIYQASFDGKRVIKLSENLYDFKEKGLYGTLNAGVVLGNQGDRLHDKTGYTFDLSGGYMFHRLIGAGLHVAYRNLAGGSDESFVPVGLEVRGYLTPTRFTPFYALRSGYGLAIDERGDQFSAEGGLYVEPMVGVRLGAASGVNATVSVGYLHQRATYEFPRNNWGWPVNEEMITQNLKYHRWTIHLGITF